MGGAQLKKLKYNMVLKTYQDVGWLLQSQLKSTIGITVLRLEYVYSLLSLSRIPTNEFKVTIINYPDGI